MTGPLIECVQLAADLDADDLRICDCRHNLAKPEWGREAYSSAHVPGAVYVDLEHDLSGPPLTDSGRHPMPSPEALTALFRRLGIGRQTRVVVYDTREGAIAARLWWQLRYMGHTSVALLNGGFDAWQRGGYPVTDAQPAIEPADFRGTADSFYMKDESTKLNDDTVRLMRPPPRVFTNVVGQNVWMGEVEPLDLQLEEPGAGFDPYNSPVARSPLRISSSQ